MTLFDEQAEFLLHICDTIQYATSLGFKVVGREFQRTAEQQEIYVRTGKSKMMNSNHLRSCAFDLYFSKISGSVCTRKNELQVVGDYFESLHKKNSWGGNWTSFLDLPHFERRP